MSTLELMNDYIAAARRGDWDDRDGAGELAPA
jgi:hypothetical protein